MALKVVLDNLDGVEESLHSLYVLNDKDSKYYLDIDGVDNHPNVTGLRTSRDKLLEEKRTAAAKMRELENKVKAIPEDFDPERWEQLKAMAEAQEADPDGKDVHKQIESATNAVRQQYESKIEAIKKKHEEEKSDLTRDRDAERSFARKNLIQSSITKALTEANIKPALMDAASLLIERRIDIIEEEDEESGERQRRVMMKPEFGGEDPSKYIQSWVQTDAGREFVLPATGANSQGNNRHRATEVNPWAKDTWNLTEQGRVLRADRAKAERMARAAGRPLATS